MSSFVVLVGLQFYILFIIQENFVIADEKTSLETSKRQVVGQCGDRKSDPLDTKIHWKDACYDFDGNSYKDGDFLMSCCGCFKFICRNKTKEDPPCDDKYGWDKVLEATCCEDCHGQVFPAGSVIKEQKLEDKCSTTVTTKCVLASGEKKATIDESLSYEKCCSNSSGVYPLNTSVLVPALCSVRVCSRPAGRHEASWTLTKKTTGCDCCQYRGKLIADKDWVIIGKGHNARNATCCEGKLLVSIDDEDVSSTTSEDETVSITTNDSTTPDSCPIGWTNFQTGCYNFVEAKIFDEAVVNCKEIGGYLSEIRSQNEQNNFRQFAENSGYRRKNIWLGAKRGQNDKWVWINSGEEMTYDNWNSGNPDNYGGNENCLSAWGSDGSSFQWNDQPCDRDDLSDLALCQQSG